LDKKKKPLEEPIDFNENPDSCIKYITENGSRDIVADSWVDAEMIRRKANKTSFISDQTENF